MRKSLLFGFQFKNAYEDPYRRETICMSVPELPEKIQPIQQSYCSPQESLKSRLCGQLYAMLLLACDSEEIIDEGEEEIVEEEQL